MTRWQEFKSAWRDLVTAIRRALAYQLVVLAMDLHPGLAAEMALIALTAAKVLPSEARSQPGDAK